MADKTVDARGLSCPQPVLMVIQSLKEMRQGTIEVLVDTETSRENVARAASMEGWRVSKEEDTGQGYKILLEK
ncbi:MAG: sulfurtransferase TusA family protein [bacterium]